MRDVVPLLAVVASIVVLAAIVCPVSATKYTVYQTGYRQLRVVAESPSRLQASFDEPGVVVVGELNGTLLTTGWDVLSLSSNGRFADEEQAYAAGYFEGVVTSVGAQQAYLNHYSRNPVPENILAWFAENIVWLEAQIAANNASDAYWYQIGLMWQQYQGLLDGINTNATLYNFTQVTLLTMTAMGDLFDLRAALEPGCDARREWRNMPKKDYDRWFARNTHCSAIVKVTDNLQDIFFGHTSWYEYTTMWRVFKHITLNYQNPMTRAKTISFSSYPGMLSSFDDYYVTDTGIVAIETSFAVFNLSMYDGNIKPQSLLYWMRVMVSTRTATSAPNWATTMALYNSGTYNNQWLIVDLSLFVPGKPLVPDTMWICEQFPGVVKSRDVTDILSFGYFPSFNVPHNVELFNVSGYAEAVVTQGPEMNDYQTCVRAEIFRRDQGNVKDLESFQKLIRYNDYEKDPISAGNPLYAIAARVDLDPDAPGCFGALDAKVSSYTLWKQGQVIYTQSGPTQQQPFFEFNNTLAHCHAHDGIPEVYRFGWAMQSP